MLVGTGLQTYWMWASQSVILSVFQPGWELRVYAGYSDTAPIACGDNERIIYDRKMSGLCPKGA